MATSERKKVPVTAQKPLRPLQSSSPKTQYLILYNFVSALLWLIVLGRLLVLLPLVGHERIYDGLGNFAWWTQLLGLMDIVHSAVGLVRAPLITTSLQIASRILILAVVHFLPHVTQSPAYSSMLFAHSVTEVVRYSFFTLSLSGFHPKALTWMRYNGFRVLYPVGISSEMWIMWISLGEAGKFYAHGWFWDLILWTSLGPIYIPGAYVLFSHMLKQSRKAAREEKAKK